MSYLHYDLKTLFYSSRFLLIPAQSLIDYNSLFISIKLDFTQQFQLVFLAICNTFRLKKIIFLCIQVESNFILESERESFIDQVQEVIDMADEKREAAKGGYSQVTNTQNFNQHSWYQVWASLLTFSV